MIRFEHTIDIKRAIDKVFSFLADFTNIPLWNYYVHEVHQLTAGPVAVGTRYHQARRTDTQRYQVTAHRRPHVIGVATQPGERPAFDRRMTLNATDDGRTRLHDRWELDTGHPKTLQRVAAGRVRAGVSANLAVLKQLLEQGTAQLPDGRRTVLQVDQLTDTDRATARTHADARAHETFGNPEPADQGPPWVGANRSRLTSAITRT